MTRNRPGRPSLPAALRRCARVCARLGRDDARTLDSLVRTLRESESEVIRRALRALASEVQP